MAKGFENTEEMFRRASGSDTCWPPCREAWSSDNPAWGHCAMYALYFNQHFLGEIVRTVALLPDGRKISHYFNTMSGGYVIDLSRSQFPPMTQYAGREVVTREEILADEETADRYRIFHARVRQY